MVTPASELLQSSEFQTRFDNFSLSLACILGGTIEPRSRRQMLDRYSQHTVQCPHCRNALAGMTAALQRAKAVSAATFFALCALAGTRGAALAAGDPFSVAAAGAGTAVLVACWVLSRRWRELCRQLTFTDFVHADNV